MSDTIPQDTPQKQCNYCKQFLPATLSYFYRNPRQPDKLRTKCRKCSDTFIQERKGTRKDGQKRCTKCKKWFPATLDYFWKYSRAKDGLEAQCKNCRKSYQEGRKDEIKEYLHLYYINHPEKWIYTRERRDHNNALMRERRKANPEKYRTIANNKRRANPERHRAEKRRQYEKHRPSFLIRARTRKMRKKAIQGIHTPEQIREQYERQKGRCYYCQKRIKWGEHHVEHTFPISRVAGTDIPANDINYIVIACKPCNLSKHDKFPWEWPEGGRLL